MTPSMNLTNFDLSNTEVVDNKHVFQTNHARQHNEDSNRAVLMRGSAHTKGADGHDAEIRSFISPERADGNIVFLDSQNYSQGAPTSNGAASNQHHSRKISTYADYSDGMQQPLPYLAAQHPQSRGDSNRRDTRQGSQSTNYLQSIQTSQMFTAHEAATFDTLNHDDRKTNAHSKHERSGIEGGILKYRRQ